VHGRWRGSWWPNRSPSSIHPRTWMPLPPLRARLRTCPLPHDLRLCVIITPQEPCSAPPSNISPILRPPSLRHLPQHHTREPRSVPPPGTLAPPPPPPPRSGWIHIWWSVVPVHGRRRGTWWPSMSSEREMVSTISYNRFQCLTTITNLMD
jgi:hypothetical protein